MEHRPEPAKTAPFRVRPAYLAVLLIAAMAVLLAWRLVAFAGAVWDTYSDTEPPEPTPFEQTVWLGIGPSKTKHAMALSLATDGSLIGKTESEVNRLLGAPLPEGPLGSNTVYYQLQYWSAGDYRLAIRFESGVVVSVTVVKYRF